MKKLLTTGLVASLILLSSFSVAHAEWVNGYQRSDGTYVQGYYRTDRNNTNIDNLSYNSRTDTPIFYDSPNIAVPTYSSPRSNSSLTSGYGTSSSYKYCSESLYGCD